MSTSLVCAVSPSAGAAASHSVKNPPFGGAWSLIISRHTGSASRSFILSLTYTTKYGVGGLRSSWPWNISAVLCTSVTYVSLYLRHIFFLKSNMYIQ